jgi:hypothetical protein
MTTLYSDYVINVLLTNGDIFANHYDGRESADNAWAKLECNPLVVHASMHDKNDDEIVSLDAITRR